MEARNFFNFFFSFSLICGLLFSIPVVYDVFVKCCAFMAVVSLTGWLMTITRKFIFYKRVSTEKKAILITGCDSGFGHALAKRMDALGYRVFAACLNDGGEGAKNLTNSCSSRLTILSLDVASQTSVDAAKYHIENNLKNDVLWAVVNNAGIPQAGEIEWTSMEDLQRVFEVNTIGTLRVTKAFLSLLRKSKGRVINNTSACGEFICPGYVGYCMSKSAAIAFSVGLRIEMMKWGVKVISVQPFFYRTPLTNSQSAMALIEKTWSKADTQTRKEYGDEYLENFKESSRQLLNRSSSKVYEVIECFEDAISAEEPLSTYYPAKFFDKIGIKLLTSLPKILAESYQRNHLERGVKPLLLMENK